MVTIIVILDPPQSTRVDSKPPEPRPIPPGTPADSVGDQLWAIRQAEG